MFFFFNDTATTEIYTLSLHDALPIPEGSATPEGALVFAGRPVVVPGRIPERAETPVVVDTDRAILAIFRPRLRPSDLQERTERSNLGGLSRAELGLVRPQLRPARLQTDEPEETAPVFQSDPALAGTRPNARPRGFAAIVQRTKPSNKPDTQSTDTTVQTDRKSTRLNSSH